MQRSTRRGFLKKVGLGAAGAAALAAAGEGRAERPEGKPRKQAGGLNVLLLMTDQQTFRALGAAGTKDIRTPNLDRLAAAGARFELATCPTPFCTPTRASIVTGLYPHSHGLVSNVKNRPGDGQKPIDQLGLPMTEQILHERGYYTGHRGKWHLGDKGNLACYRDLPEGLDHGYAGFDYDEFLDERLAVKRAAKARGAAVAFGRPVEMIPACRQGHEKYVAHRGLGGQLISIIGRSAVPAELTPEACITDQAMKMIEANASGDWMVTASWGPPHALWVAPEPYYSMHDRKKMPRHDDRDKLPAWMRNSTARKLGDFIGPDGIAEYQAIYRAQVAMMDAQVGRLLKKLDELKLTDRTLVIFTSDHGDMQGRFGAVGKTVPAFYEEILRVPLLMRLPGKIKPGTVVSRPVTLVDMMPTILDYAGVKGPEGIHGRALRPLIEGRDVQRSELSFAERTNPYGTRPSVQRMIRSNRWKYCYYGGDRGQLFDLVNDPMERDNLFADNGKRQTVRDMHGRLLEWMKQTGDRYRKDVPTDPYA